MGKYIAKFSDIDAYSAGVANLDKPCVCLIENTGCVIYDPETYEDSHEAVDLGLPSGTLWATCNIGAENPEDSGLFFQWGGVKGKPASYTGDFFTYEKRMDNPGALLEGDIPQTAQYDAARAHWGKNWHIPTKEQFMELKKECTLTWTTLNGVNGYEVEGHNGNTIFLPAAGGFYGGNSISHVGTYGRYWESTMDSIGAGCECFFDDSDFHPDSYDNRCYGSSVRPVQ